MFDKLKFTKPKQLFTKKGPKYMRYWELPDDSDVQKGFWNFWKKNKFSMMNRGFSVYKDKKTKKWQLQEWKDRIQDFPEYKNEPEIELVSDLDVKPLKNSDGLREWQAPAAATLVAAIKKHGAAIDGSDTGAGKTYTAVGAARELGYSVAVVCPKAVIESWKRVVQNHFKVPLLFVMNYEALKGGKHKHILELKKKDRSNLTEYVWHLPKKTLLIFDESHRLKGKGTKNAQMATAAKRQGIKILCCSATNAINPLELNAVGEILGLHKGNQSFYKWCYSHGCTKGRFGMEFTGGKNTLRKLHKDIFLDRGTRLKKDEIPGFPESEIIAEPYSLDDSSTTQIDKIYFDMHKELSALEKKTTKDKRGMALTIRLRARQKVELLKVPLFVEMAEDLIADGQSVVIMVNFSDTIKALSKKLKTKCIIWGDNKKDERQKFIDAFQADEERIMLLNIQAGGVGVSLHDLNGNYPRTALISPNDSAPLLRQAFGRIHRDGAKTKSQQRVIFVANTVEEAVCANVKRKLTNLDLINDGDLSPDYKTTLKE